MPQREGETDYKYEDYAADMAYHRIPATDELVGESMTITLDNGVVYDLKFTSVKEVEWKSGDDGATDWYEAMEVAPKTYYIDIAFAANDRRTVTFFVNSETRQALCVDTFMREETVDKEPRAMQDFTPGVLGDASVAPTGLKPAPTRDLIGLKALYVYNPNQVFEHNYINEKRFCWQCVVGPLKGEADVELVTTYKFDINQYVFSWREFGLPVCTVFFHNWDQMRETGKFLAIGEDGQMANTPAGALIRKLSVAFYPEDMLPL